MIDELVKPSNDPERWKACADELNNSLLSLDMDAAQRKASAALPEKDAEAERMVAFAEVKKAINLAQVSNWPAVRMHYTLGRLDTKRALLCCERKILDWQSLLNAKAAFGTGRDVETVFEQARLAGVALDLAMPLRHAAKPVLLVAGLRHEGNADTVDRLLRMGADPATDNGGVFQTAVLEGRADIGRIIARHGQQGLLDTAAWMNWARQNRKVKALPDFRDIWWEYGRYQALDHETLVETKPMPDNTGNLRILFNFAARRVEEIHEFTNPKQNLVTSFSFDDYGQSALEAARDKLIELGGRPSDIGQTLRGKGAIARPAALGLGGKP
jgi:hypothetical protein